MSWAPSSQTWVPAAGTFLCLQNVGAAASGGKDQDWRRSVILASPSASACSGGRLGRSHPLGQCFRPSVLQGEVVPSLPTTQDTPAVQGACPNCAGGALQSDRSQGSLMALGWYQLSNRLAHSC